MRLWHKDLIPVLPDKQLLGQWRECCAIASNIANKGAPNHLLVNKIKNYSIEHFYAYGNLVYMEMVKRGFKANFNNFDKNLYFDRFDCLVITSDVCFVGWHNERYLIQCFYNLQEKYDCGGISEEDYRKIFNTVAKRTNIDLLVR